MKDSRRYNHSIANYHKEPFKHYLKEQYSKRSGCRDHNFILIEQIKEKM